MRALATWCFRHRRLVVAFWLTALIIVTLASRSIGSDYTNSFSLPHTQSTRAIDLLQKVSPRVSGDTEQVVVQTSDGKLVTDPAVEARVKAMLTRVATVPHVTNIVSPYAAAATSTHISADKTVAFASVTFDRQTGGLNKKIADDLVRTAQSADEPGVKAAVAGNLAELADKQSFGGSGLGIILAAVVLLLVFGSVFAMALPLLSALASLGTAIGLNSLLSHILKMPQFSPELVLLIGLGVGVDYALFIVTRHRQGLIAGGDVESSVVTAVDTSGRAVLFAGIIVCIALLGMFALGVSFLYGLAVAAALGVLLTMVAALTLLPALLGFIGPRVLSRKQKRNLATTGPRIVGAGNKGFWPRWADFILRRPAGPALVALVIIVAIASPFFTLRLGASDQGNDPAGTTTRQAYDMLATGFGPGFNGPLQLVASSPTTISPALLDRLVTATRNEPGVARVAPTTQITAKDSTHVALIEVYPTSAPQDAATSRLISRLRQQVIPTVLAGSHLTIYVGGITAIFVDFAHVLSSKLPFFVGLVVVLSFILLAIVFRSLVIPLTAAVMNLLSIGAAFGIITAVFQHGWLGDIFGVNRPGPIEAFLPVMLFAILFGLSMDYEVFLVSRIHEEYLKSGDNRLAVRSGLAATGKTITAAALIMILVFGSFILGGERVIKEFGLGLAGGILIDAIIIRMTIVPAVMSLLGKSNWWFPKGLDKRLPHIGAGGPPVPATVGPVAGEPQGAARV